MAVQGTEIRLNLTRCSSGGSAQPALMRVLLEELGLERDRGPTTLSSMTQLSPFRYFETSREVIHLAAMLAACFA